jgi:glycosyltransferase involved in cell wall biosynthesis
MLEALGQARPALIHAHFGPDTTKALSIASALSVPLVTTFHGYDPTMLDLGISASDGQLEKTATRFLCSSLHIRERLISSGFPTAKLQVHHTGVDTQYFTADPQIERTPIVLFAGPLVEGTGCKVLIRAMFQVEGVVPQAKLVVIGDGPLHTKLQRFAQKFQRNIEFLGAQDPRSTREWMNRATVFCTPVMGDDLAGDMAGAGMAYVEAQSMGLPVVGYASGSIPEVVGPEGMGLLVKDDDWEALATNILGLLLTPSHWARYSRAAEARARMLFDIRRQSAALEDIYQEVLDESRPCATPSSGLPLYGMPQSVYSALSA